MTTTNGVASSALGPSKPLDHVSSHRQTSSLVRRKSLKSSLFKLKSFLLLMHPGYANAFREIEDSPETEITDAAFLDEADDPKPALMNMAGQLQ